MRSRQLLTICVVVLAIVSVILPVAALAGSGPSASNGQYVDPLAGVSTHTTSTQTSAASTPPVASTPTAGAAANAAASSATATTASAPANTLPYTGYQAWLVAALGAGLAGIGGALRRRLV